MKTKTASLLITASLASPIVLAMSRPELRATAKALKIPVGRSDKATRTNLINAVENKQAHIKVVADIYAPDAQKSPNVHGDLVLRKKLRTYKPNRTLFPAPAPSAS